MGKDFNKLCYLSVEKKIKYIVMFPNMNLARQGLNVIYWTSFCRISQISSESSEKQRKNNDM